jgi:hypothetical protein
MKTIKSILVLTCLAIMTSCGGGTNSHPATANGFDSIEQDLKDKFGDNAYYTDLNISYDKSVGNMISLTVTEKPESLKMGAYVYSSHTNWQQNSEITLEVPDGTAAKDFMFQLNDKINLKKLGELVEVSGKKLTAEKDIENPAFEMAFVKFPKNGDITEAEYVVKLEPENGGTSFSFFYKLDGELIKMNY